MTLRYYLSNDPILFEHPTRKVFFIGGLHDSPTQPEALYTEFPQVTDYLIKRGYVRTEEAFKKEISGNSSAPNEGENKDKAKEKEDKKRLAPEKYDASFEHLVKWVDSVLEIYKVSKAMI